MSQTINPRIITDESLLASYLEGKNPECFTDRLHAFIRQQCETWPELKEARGNLAQSLTKTFFLSGLEVRLQHNPYRIKSSSTRVDKAFIDKRPCFLCPDRLYPDQKALVYQRSWLILNNPYPIFPDHLVIASRDHLPQDIHSCLGAMTDFVQDSNFSFTSFYNGPACGASAPDHLHFQACPEGGIPVTAQLDHLLCLHKGASPFTAAGGHASGTCLTGELDRRAVFICLTGDKAFLVHRMTAVVDYLKEKTRQAEEPKINVIISPYQHSFMGLIFPRRAHRPACYFRDDPGKMLVSPGAVDIGGLIILPRRQDYDGMTAEVLLGIFSEVCYEKDIFRGLGGMDW